MTHGDDAGLRVPPLLAPTELVIVPIYRTDEERSAVLEAAARIERELGEWERREPNALRVHVDRRDGMKPGAKYYDWELRGVPLRLELGPRDLANQQGVLVRRDTKEKKPVSLGVLGEEVEELLERIQDDMLIAARDRREANSIRGAITYDRFREVMDGEGGVRVRRMVRKCRVRGADQGRDEGDDPCAARRGVSLGRGAAHVSQVWSACDGRGAVGESVLTSTFARVDGGLVCEEVLLSTIARAVGTPTYVYSANAVREQYARLSAALDGVPFRIHYSLKANSNLALLRLLRSLGAAADVVSGGELFRARRAGFEPHDIVFGGVGKTEREIADGIDAGVLMLNIESDDELRMVDRLGTGARRGRPGCDSREPGDHGRDATLVHPHRREGAQVRGAVRRSARRRPRRRVAA